MLVILGVVTFLDRINISVAGSSIMKDLNLSAAEWGWVQSAFILSYGLMQIPMGAYGDRHGHRKVLTLFHGRHQSLVREERSRKGTGLRLGCQSHGRSTNALCGDSRHGLAGMACCLLAFRWTGHYLGRGVVCHV